MKAAITRQNEIENVTIVHLTADSGFQIQITEGGDGGFLIRPTAGYELVPYDGIAFEILPSDGRKRRWELRPVDTENSEQTRSGFDWRPV